MSDRIGYIKSAPPISSLPLQEKIVAFRNSLDRYRSDTRPYTPRSESRILSRRLKVDRKKLLLPILKYMNNRATVLYDFDKLYIDFKNEIGIDCRYTASK
jgi:hypothetical protein